ncbi:MAG TPA: hypothetical protein VFV38_29235 [Ktedonobacteraceae bacterium]|nr:hypothetical protein [Ktedonobacteraceae bacterium]
MAHDELRLSFSEDPNRLSNICAGCGNAAEIHLSLLEGTSHQGGSFCLSCGEMLISRLRKQRAEHASVLTGATDADHRSFLRSDFAYDEMEGGIIFWEGHGWSSDGPFAGA